MLTTGVSFLGKSSKRVFVFLYSLYGFSVLFSGCQKKELPQDRAGGVLVKVADVRTVDMRKVLHYVGDIKAQQEINVYSKVSGKLIENKFQEGDSVKKGDVLALLDRDEVGFRFEKAPVISPIDGTVGRVYLDKGARIMPGTDLAPGTPVALVVDMDSVRVKVNVTERELPEVKEGQLSEITVSAYPDEVFIGEVSRVSPVVDSLSRTAPVEISISNEDHRLKSGMFARVGIITREKESALVVPIEAIVHREGNQVVFVVDGTTAKIREVETGIRDGDNLEIISGLREGEKVIIEGAYGLSDGATIGMR